MQLATYFPVPSRRKRRAHVRKRFREAFPAESRLAELEAYIELAERRSARATDPMFPSLTQGKAST